MAELDQNLLDWFEQADSDQLAAGLTWYPEAEALAVRLEASTAGRVSRLQACAVIAVLSPRCSWPENKRAAVAVVEAWAAGLPARGLRVSGVYPENIGKAYRVLAGDVIPDVCDGTRVGRHGRPVECKPTRDGCACPVHGPKVAAFYRAIAGLADDGCMDIWATRAARINPAEACGLAGDDPRRNQHPELREHEILAAAYRRAAKQAGVSARAFQAVVWLAVRSSWTKSNGTAFSAPADIPF